MAAETDRRQLRCAVPSAQTLDSMDMLLQLSGEDDSPIESLAELLKRTEYVEEALRHHAMPRA